MPAATRNTVERLDKPSAYYIGRVSIAYQPCNLPAQTRTVLIRSGLNQNKKRKYGKDRDDENERERTPEEPEDPLKDATTLYVGNLFVGPSEVG